MTETVARASAGENLTDARVLFRVFVGPYPTRDEAKRTADRLRDVLGLPSTIAVHPGS